MCVGSLADVTYLRYTALTSPKKGETAVHCCDPALSVLVILVSRNVFHVVSALQLIVKKNELTEDCAKKSKFVKMRLRWHLSPYAFELERGVIFYAGRIIDALPSRTYREFE